MASTLRNPLMLRNSLREFGNLDWKKFGASGLKAKLNSSFGCCSRTETGLLIGYMPEDGPMMIDAAFVVSSWNRRCTSHFNARLQRRFGQSLLCTYNMLNDSPMTSRCKSPSTLCIFFHFGSSPALKKSRAVRDLILRRFRERMGLGDPDGDLADRPSGATGGRFWALASESDDEEDAPVHSPSPCSMRYRCLTPATSPTGEGSKGFEEFRKS